MALMGLLLVLAAYTWIESFVVTKLFPSAEMGPLCIAFGISNVLAYFVALLNGIIPTFPLTDQDMWSFIAALFMSCTAWSTATLKISLTQIRLDWLTSFIIISVLNLILSLVLGIPLFFATLGVSTDMFK